MTTSSALTDAQDTQGTEITCAACELILVANAGNAQTDTDGGHPVRIPILLSLGSEQVFAYVRGVNSQGIRLELNAPICVGTTVNFGFSLPGTSNLVSISAQVVWIDQSGRLAIRSLEPSDVSTPMRDWFTVDCNQKDNKFLSTISFRRTT